MIKILLTVAVLGSVGGFAGLAMAQGKQGEAFGSEVSSQCAHRRVMAPDPHNDCFRKLRSDAQMAYGQGGASARSLDQRDEGQPKVSREQPETSTPPKVATVPVPKAKKADTRPRLDAQKEQQLYQEFWNGEIADCFMRPRPSENSMMLVPPLDLEFLTELAAGGVGTSNRRH